MEIDKQCCKNCRYRCEWGKLSEYDTVKNHLICSERSNPFKWGFVVISDNDWCNKWKENGNG